MKEQTIKSLKSLPVKLSTYEVRSAMNYIQNFLDEQGFGYFSSGMFSRCYRRPEDDYVIKVFNSKKDPAYYGWVKKIQKLNSVHIPKIYSIIEIKLETENICLVFIENLIKQSEVPYPVFKTLMSEYFSIEIDHPRQGISLELEEWIISSADETFEPINKVLLELLNDSDIQLDIHNGNIMYRRTNQEYIPVFIDPVCPIA